MRFAFSVAALMLLSNQTPAQAFWQLDSASRDFALSGPFVVAGVSDITGPKITRGDLSSASFGLISAHLPVPPSASYTGSAILLSPGGQFAATMLSSSLSPLTCIRWSGYSLGGTPSSFQSSVGNASIELFPGFQLRAIAADGTLSGEDAGGTAPVPGQMSPNGIFSYLQSSTSFGTVAAASDDGMNVLVNRSARAELWRRNGPSSPLIVLPGALSTSGKGISADGGTAVGTEISSIIGGTLARYALWQHGMAERVRNTPLVGEFARGDLLIAFNDGTALGIGDLNGASEVTLVQPDIFGNIPLLLAWPLAGYPSPQLPRLTGVFRGREAAGYRFALVQAINNQCFLLQIPNGSPLRQPRLGLADYLFPGIPNQLLLDGGTAGAPFILLLGNVDGGGAFSPILQLGQSFDTNGRWNLNFVPPAALGGLRLAIGAIGFNPGTTGLFALERAVEFP